MAHLRTKRKNKKMEIEKLIFSLVLVFIFMAILITISNLFKDKKLDINSSYSQIINTTKSEVISPIKITWILNHTNIMLTPNDNIILIQKAITAEEKNQGLSGKDKLKFSQQGGKIITEGMLFVFDTEGTWRFWMKDMNFDLDMIFMDKDFKIVSIIKDAKANSYNAQDPNSSQIYTNGNTPAKYVLEINSSYSDKINLRVGDILRMQ